MVCYNNADKIFQYYKCDNDGRKRGTMNQDRYNGISRWVRDKKYRYKTFLLLYRLIPALVIISYGAMILYAIFKMEREQLVRIIVVPAITFLIVTLFRKLINEKRPYEVYAIQPLIHKEKQGESFPSRHMVSVTIIAMAGWYMNIWLGIWLTFLTVIVGILRPIAGVHFIRDIIGAVCLSVIIGIVGFYLF